MFHVSSLFSRIKFSLLINLMFFSLLHIPLPVNAETTDIQSPGNVACIAQTQKNLIAFHRTIAELSASNLKARFRRSGDIYYVAGDAVTSGRGSSWTQAFKTIQEAVDAASDHDVIWIKKGTYPLAAPIAITKTLIVQGGFTGTETAPEQRTKDDRETVLDGQNETRCLQLSADAYLEALTISRGTVRAEQNNFGGGILISGCSPVIRTCRFRENLADVSRDSLQPGRGGALYIINGRPSISDCTFEKNSAGPKVFNATDGQGGAAYCTGGGLPAFLNCVFKDNYADADGGAVYGKVCLLNCNFRGNFVAGNGGAVYALPGSVVSDSVFNKNSAEYSGGALSGGGKILHCQFNTNNAADAGGGAQINSDSTLYRCTFSGNVVTNNYAQNLGGGALQLRSGTHNLILSSVFYNNDIGILDPLNGGAIYNEGYTEIFNSTFYGNSTYSSTRGAYGKGGAIYAFGKSNLTLTNCILWGNRGGPAAIEGNGTPINVAYCDIDQSSFAGSSFNISLDPRFVDAANGDLHLAADSPCIDAGFNKIHLAILRDFDGDKRIINGKDVDDCKARIDIGADEYKPQ